MDYYVISFSGGKDSTALALEWLRLHLIDPVQWPLHEVINCDVGMEFPAMYTHIERIEKIFKNAGIKFTRLKAEKTFEYLMSEHITSNKQNVDQKVKGYGWPSMWARWCTSELKIRVISKHLKELKRTHNVVQLIGIAFDEKNRLLRKNNQDPSHLHPLADWQWSEAFCLDYCYRKGFDWVGLYKLFTRVSCWCCPLQSLADLRTLRIHFPELWCQLIVMEHSTWNKIKADYTVDELDVRFQFEEERLANNLPINTREFHRELKLRLADIAADKSY